MNIATFGCSFTSGLEQEGGYNWVRFYARKYPQHTFYNLAYPGSSLAFQMFLLKEIKKHVRIDKTIFQITTPFRFTYFNDFNKFNIMELEKENNLNYFKLGFNDNIDPVLPTQIHMPQIWESPSGKKKEARLRKFAEDYIGKISPQVETVDYVSKIEWLRNKADFIFFHREPTRFFHEFYADLSKRFPTEPLPELDDIACLEKEISRSKFIDFAIDTQYHFSEDGACWEADWVDSKFKLD
jgi:hypothetical protein